MENDETSNDPVEHVASLLPEGKDLPQSVTMEAFCHREWGAAHLDQARAFANWCRKAGHVRHSVAEWKALLGEFSSRPIGAQV